MRINLKNDKETVVEDFTLDIDIETVRTLGYRIVDIITDELADPSRRPPRPPMQSKKTLEALFGGPLPQEGVAPGELLTAIQEHLLPASSNLAHPRWLGYVLAGSLPLAGLIGALISTLDLPPFDPANTHITMTVARWLGEMLGFAKDSAGYITTGGSWANLVGLAVARVRRAGWEVRMDGLAGHPPLFAYVSEEGHSCLDKSMELLGLGRNQLRKIPVDSSYRIQIEALEEAIKTDRAANFQPFCIIGNAGTVNTGAVDPLDILADIADRHNLWFHVDGAYGAFAALVPEYQPTFFGLERADSLAVDPHKWLNIPIEAGCILVRDWIDLTNTFSIIPPYLRAAAGDKLHLVNCGFELTRTNRELKIWLALQQYGVDGYTKLISNHLVLTRQLAAWVEEADDFEVMCEPSLSICCFRFVPPDLKRRKEEAKIYLNKLNQAIEMALIEDGRALVSGTELQGKRVLRVCIVNHRVTQTGVEETIVLLREFGYKLDKQMREKSF